MFDSTYTSYVEYRIVKFIVRKYSGRCQRQGVGVGRENRESLFIGSRVSV